MVSVGVVAIDGTKVAANASREANRGYEQIARQILAEAAETDRREDVLYGEARGDELPERLRTSAGRRAALCEAKRELARQGELAYRRTVTDWQAHNKGAGATPGRASQGRQSGKQRGKASVPDPTL